VPILNGLALNCYRSCRERLSSFRGQLLGPTRGLRSIVTLEIRSISGVNYCTSSITRLINVYLTNRTSSFAMAKKISESKRHPSQETNRPPETVGREVTTNIFAVIGRRAILTILSYENTYVPRTVEDRKYSKRTYNMMIIMIIITKGILRKSRDGRLCRG